MDWHVWQAISRRLHRFFDLYLMDLRGHGESDKPGHGYSLAHYAADVEDLLEALHLQGVTMVGSSLGGMVAACVEAPVDIVTHRVLVDPPLTGGPIRDRDMFMEIRRLKHEPEEQLADYLGRFNPGAGRHYLQVMSHTWHLAADGVIDEMLAHPDDYYAVDGALRGIESPTLILQADHALGAVLTDAAAQHALAQIPRARLARIPGAGHAIHAYKPEEFVRQVHDFTRDSS
jgi:pimeloyl-ACP methyl ester carboxylesterase